MERKLRRMRKIELLELLLEQEQEIQRLQEENEALTNKLDLQRIKIEESGSIAEAALKLNEIFETAQKAADLYLNSVKANSEAIDGIEEENGKSEQTVDIRD